MSDATRLRLGEVSSSDVADADTFSAFNLPVPCTVCGGRDGREYVRAGGHLIRACLCGQIQSIYMPATEPEEASGDV